MRDTSGCMLYAQCPNTPCGSGVAHAPCQQGYADCIRPVEHLTMHPTSRLMWWKLGHMASQISVGNRVGPTHTRSSRAYTLPTEKESFIDNLVVRIHFIIVTIRCTSLAPWEFEFPFPGSLTCTFLTPCLQKMRSPPLATAAHKGKFRYQNNSSMPQGAAVCNTVGSYRGTSLIRNCPPLGSCSKTMPRTLWWSWGGELFLMSEVPLYVI